MRQAAIDHSVGAVGASVGAAMTELERVLSLIAALSALQVVHLWIAKRDLRRDIRRVETSLRPPVDELARDLARAATELGIDDAAKRYNRELKLRNDDLIEQVRTMHAELTKLRKD